MIFNVDVDNTVNDFIEKFVLLYNDISKSDIDVSEIVDYDLTKLNVSRETVYIFINNIKL